MIAGAGYVKTQSMDFHAQFKAGIRFLDIRARHSNDSFPIHHGNYYLHKNFADVLRNTNSFLSNNPSEVIFIRLKEESTPDNNSRSFVETFESYMKNVDLGRHVWRGSNKNPSLGELRGKIVILDDFDGSSSYAYIEHSKNDFSIQDNYNPDNGVDKIKSIKKHFADAATDSSNNKYINYLSGYITAIYTPKGLAKQMNSKSHDYIANHLDKRLGFVIADFPGKDLIQDLINANNSRLFNVVSGFNNKCLDIDVASSNVQVWDCSGNTNQQWHYDLQTAQIRSPASNYCLDAAAPGGNLYMSPCHGGANQKWDLLLSGEIKDRAHGQCIDLYQFNDSNGANVKMHECNNLKNQKWYAGKGYKKITGYNNKCLDVDENSSNVQMWDCSGWPNQRWTYNMLTGEIKSGANDKCLDASSNGNVYMYKCHGGDNQRWDILPTTEIRSRANRQCLDLFEFNDSDGANVQMYNCNNRKNQRWAWKQ
nr:phosphatidylinositol-specific phospholipase C domain-containing protein [Spartinivicinus marinus]